VKERQREGSKKRVKAVFVGWLCRLSAAGGQVAFVSQETIYGLFFPFYDM